METKPQTLAALKIQQVIHNKLDYPRFSLCSKNQGHSNKLVLITGYPGGGMASYYSHKRRIAALKLSTTPKD